MAKGAPLGNAPDSPHGSPLLAVARLLRIALLPSALCDVITGLAIGYAGRVPESAAPWLLIPASLGVYHGAMALNDWADRRDDASARPDRPIPSGAVPAGVALIIAATLMVGGVLWAAGAGLRAGAVMLAVAVLAALYDVAGRGPVRGPLLLGLCRFGNLGVGAAAAYTIEGDALQPVVLLPALAYGAHVFFIGRLGRLEDEEDDRPLGQRPTAALRGAAATALLIPPATWWAVREAAAPANVDAATWGLLLGMALAARSAFAIHARAREGAREGWTRSRVEGATGEVLRRLPTTVGGAAAAVLLLGNLGFVALVVALAGGKVSGVLRRWFPLT